MDVNQICKETTALHCSPAVKLKDDDANGARKEKAGHVIKGVFSTTTNPEDKNEAEPSTVLLSGVTSRGALLINGGGFKVLTSRAAPP